MTARPGFWYAVVLLCALFAATLMYRAPGVAWSEVVAFFAVVSLLTGALMVWAGRPE